MDRSDGANPESGNAPPGSKWGAAREPAADPTGGDGSREARASTGAPTAEEQGNFGEGEGVAVPSLETSRDVPGSNRGG